MSTEPKPLEWVSSSKKDLVGLPKEVRVAFGVALFRVQCGAKPMNAKPLKGFGGAGVLEIVENFDGDTFRAVYTVRFAEVVYVLHVFQKKSKSGIATPKQEIDLIKSRLALAEDKYIQWQKDQQKKQ